MKLASTVKKVSIVAALGMGLSVFAAAPGNTASAATNNPNAQKLVNSLEALQLDHVDYLYAYLQSITLSNAEYQGIISNANQVGALLNGKSADSLSNADKAKALRLFLNSIKLAHLQASFVDDNGNAIDITNYRPGTTGLQVVLMDLKGNVLATIDPKKSDLAPGALQAKINALVSAVNAKRALDKTSDKFVPMPQAELPNTSTNDMEFVLLGALLIALGGIALVPAARAIRKSGDTAEA